MADIPDLTSEQFRKFADLIRREASITLREQKIVLLSNRLRRRALATGCANFDEYFAFVTSKPEERRPFLEAITTNESYFWRSTASFDLMKKVALPQLLKAYPKAPIQIWSAGCSTGEEPYNIAMEVTEAMKSLGVFPYQVIATDISARVVDFAKVGRYSGRKIEKIPPLLLYRYFRADPESKGQFLVRDDLRTKIDFRVENLFESTPRNVHCIFCRNVMIYFQKADQEILIRRFYDALVPGGFLLVGHSESLHVLQADFTPVHCPDGVIYRK
ncbi:MAG TPA: protein-glutamate O-methyltransferase CheR [Leptospiraceae bacterium]|nr:protein-glutamate O-methyltransferase CheR [Leptospiraceae bacterium]HNJ06018.1 protein-glutamate O-methyltransferase CheR [Leptospiraceae bacterium]HNL01962.1 protein-glutamate O-methyltransferase CheR [Leptospiraceae bacterium]HNL68800.1 protein-glutamate O-methyltransferase CheR [Leptospiraceae bacterium]HQI20114.1 protein-glutamate O-methyltransferase CheR [Leptospiraceae bacterium]